MYPPLNQHSKIENPPCFPLENRIKHWVDVPWLCLKPPTQVWWPRRLHTLLSQLLNDNHWQDPRLHPKCLHFLWGKKNKWGYLGFKKFNWHGLETIGFILGFLVGNQFYPGDMNDVWGVNCFFGHLATQMMVVSYLTSSKNHLGKRSKIQTKNKWIRIGRGTTSALKG